MLDAHSLSRIAPSISGSGFSIDPRGPFELEAAVRFSSGWEAASVSDDTSDELLRLAFALDDFSGHACVSLRQNGTTVTGEVTGTDATDVAARQAARILALDVDGSDYPGVGERDPVVARLQALRPGLRPVSFHSPYEAAAWSIVSARTPHPNARRLRTHLAATYGRTFAVGGGQLHAFPLAEQVLGIEGPVPGMSDEKLRRLRDVAEAALAGLLDASALRAMERADAEAQLQGIRGIGPFYSQLILVRSCGAADLTVTTEKRLSVRIAELYGADADPAMIADNWRPFRTWTAVLLRSTA